LIASPVNSRLSCGDTLSRIYCSARFGSPPAFQSLEWGGNRNVNSLRWMCLGCGKVQVDLRIVNATNCLQTLGPLRQHVFVHESSDLHSEGQANVTAGVGRIEEGLAGRLMPISFDFIARRANAKTCSEQAERYISPSRNTLPRRTNIW
jgi:hypothetical protein